MIRKAQFDDAGSIFRIWKTCFGDDDAYINFFLEKFFLPERCLLAVIDGEPAAMLHLLPINYYDGVKQAKAQYIYAAATLPQYRRRGIMAELIDYAFLLSEQHACAFTALLPANDGLYDYYKKCGFHTAFHVKLVHLSRNELETLATSSGDIKQTQPETELMFMQRQGFFTPAVLWGRELFDYIVAEWRFTGGEVLSWENGYCLYRRNAESIVFKEVCVKPKDVTGLLKELLKIGGSNQFIFQLADGSNLFTGGKSVRYGMIKTSNNTANFSGGTYFNMMLD